MKIITIIGARPQFIKASVVSRALSAYNRNVDDDARRISEKIIHTGQHYNPNMSQVFFDELNIPTPDYSLNIGSGSHGSMTGAMLQKIETVLLTEKPDYALVYGDTNSTLAGALAAAKLTIPVAHVEAGLRSYNRNMPEEINRLVTDHISDLLFCPTPSALENLKKEGIATGCEPANLSGKTGGRKRTVALVGDVMLDAALYFKKHRLKTKFELPDRFILATLHRAENTDNSERLRSIFNAFQLISMEIPIFLPIHPRTRKAIAGLISHHSTSGLHIIEPVSYREMIFLLEKCAMVMTDSGGLQKEAFFFAKSCVTLRDETEWIELVNHGYNRLAGSKTKRICAAAKEMLATKIDSLTHLYGQGDAGEKIVNILRSI